LSFPEGRIDSTGRAEPVPPAEVGIEFVRALRTNRVAGTIDQLIVRNTKVRYYCLWAQADQGEWLCIWALDVHGWVAFGDPRLGSGGCFGAYLRSRGDPPPGAAVSTAAALALTSPDSLDPFIDH
jgi:hypothetical protein